MKVLYYALKINGLAPFQINSQQGIVKNTKRSFYYYFIFGAVMQVLTIFAYRNLYLFFSHFEDSNIQTLVIRAEISVQLFKSILVFFFNLLYHNDLTDLINASILFKQIITNITPHQTLFDDILIRQYTVRSVAFVVELFIMLCSFMVIIFDPNKVLNNLSWTVTLYNHFNALLVSSIFFYGGLVTSSRFLRMANNHLEFCIYSIRNRKNADSSSVSNESAMYHLDQFGIFFGKFSSITNKFFHIYGFQILLALLASATYSLTSVREFNLTKRRFFKKANILKFYYIFDAMYKQPLLNVSIKINGAELFDTLSVAAIHISELFFIVAGAHTINTEVKSNFL